MHIDQELTSLKRQLKAQSNPDRAQGEKNYLKHDLNHYGLTMPQIVKLAKSWHKEYPGVSIDQEVKLADKLWHSSWHEERTLAVELLCLRSNDLTSKHLPRLEHMMGQVTTWAHLDPIAILLVGGIIDSNPSSLKYLSKWIKSPNYWIRRAAIIAQILQFRQGRGDMKLFEDLVKTQLTEPKSWDARERFFIRKAIGWALRERSKADPQSVVDFVNKYHDSLSGLSYHEATRKLPANHHQSLT